MVVSDGRGDIGRLDLRGEGGDVERRSKEGLVRGEGGLRLHSDDVEERVADNMASVRAI